ncbi:MAG TPA: amino acid adenylation domain-containing protein, partial [Candidatus Deferrimicrobium sp.]|nr:amino acid adenylation domain-containing protein [Candidatus Deferrimicrobium sp.]
AALHKLAAANHVTLNTVAQTLWGIILGKYNGKEDVVFGAVVSGRPVDLEGVESMVGLFINTIPVRIRFAEKMKFYRLIQQVQQEALAAEPYHYHPLAEIQARTALKQNLIDHILVFENYPIAGQITGKQLPVKLVNVEVFQQTNYDLNIILEGVERLTIKFQYNGNVYDRDFVERIAGHFYLAVGQAIENQELEVGELTLLSEEEKNCLLYEFNNTEVDYPKNKTIHQLFAEQVERAPDRVSLVGAVSQTCLSSLSYNELNGRSGQLAGLLIEKGVLADTIVGIMVERSLEMIIGILGILKAGGAYLPIDPDYPQERIDYMLKDSGAKIMVGNWHACSEIHHSSFIVHHSSHSNHLAYILYTSGSTGQPKGVMVTHRNVVRLVKNTNFVPLTEDTRILQTGAPVFDATTFEIWGSLLNGGQLVLVPKEVILEAHRLAKELINHCINTLWLSAPLFNQLLQQDSELFAPLSYLLVGGDSLSPGHINRAKRQFPALKIINGYGPTENTTFSTTYLIEKEFERNIPIGRPIANSTAYIYDIYDSYDKCLRLAPIGAVGELVVGGDGVARGYLNNPELTAAKFKHDLWDYRDNQDEKNKRLARSIYKTGDLARWLLDGNIEFLGRSDQQIKIRGFRVEPGEIENRLANYPGIKEAVVWVLEED